MKNKFRLIAILMIFVLILSGCGKSSDESGNNTTPTESLTPTAAPSVPGGSGSASDSTNGSDGEMHLFDTTSDYSHDGSSSTSSGDPIAKFDGSVLEALTEAKAADSSLWSGLSTDGFATDEGGSWDMSPDGFYDASIFTGEYSGETDIDTIYDPMRNIAPRAGLLTAGEWNDNRNFDFLKKLLANGQDENFSQYFHDWDLAPFSRLVISASCEDGSVMANAPVKVFDANGNLLWSCRTDSAGTAYAYYNSNGALGVPASLIISHSGEDYNYTVSGSDLDDDAVIRVSFGTANHTPKALDLLFMIDTTGSMWDELEYLQAELEDVINRVKNANPNLSLRLSVNFYRDLEDAYIVRSYPFSTNIDEELRYLKAEFADGGGDYEEAVELALDDAVNNHDWSEDAVKLAFFVLDAPPHNTSEIRTSLASSLEKAAAAGIRIIPIAASGVDKTTEFLLRAFAMVTGGTYTFLTDDSGIGGSHLTPTVGSYVVEQLCDLIVRLIDEYITGIPAEPVPATIPEKPVPITPIEPFEPVEPMPDPVDPIEPIDPIIDPVEPFDPSNPITGIPEHSNTSLIITTEEGTTAEMIREICLRYSDYGLDIIYDYENLNMFALGTAIELSDEELSTLINDLNAEECITEASFDYIYSIY